MLDAEIAGNPGAIDDQRHGNLVHLLAARRPLKRLPLLGTHTLPPGPLRPTCYRFAARAVFVPKELATLCKCSCSFDCIISSTEVSISRYRQGFNRSMIAQCSRSLQSTNVGASAPGDAGVVAGRRRPGLISCREIKYLIPVAGVRPGN